MTEPNETQLTIEEALLRRRGVESEMEAMPEPTLDETIQASFREEELKEQLTDQPQEEETMIPTSFQGEMPTSSTPQASASIGNLPPVDKTSTPAYPERGVTTAGRLLDIRPVDFEAYKVAEFLAGPDFSVHYVERQLRLLSTIPEMIPPTNQWNIPAGVDLSKIVYDTILTPGFVLHVWPIVRMLMGTSIGNVVWEVKVICTIALMEVIRMLGLAHG